MRVPANADVPEHDVVFVGVLDRFNPTGRQVLPPSVTTRVAVEQASTFGWERYIGSEGRVIGMRTFGASAPLRELQRRFGFEPDRVTATARELLGKSPVR